MKSKLISIILVLAMLFNVAVMTGCGVGGGINPGNNGSNNSNGSEEEIILLVDASYSMKESKEEIDLFVKSVIDANNGARLGIVTFGHNQVYAVELSDDLTDAYAKYLAAEAPDNDATNIADAIRYASTLFTTNTSKTRPKIVLISDGAETDSNAIEAVMNAVANGITVDTVPFVGEKAEKEVQILSVKLPDEKIELGKEFTVEVTIQSTYESVVTFGIYDNQVAGATKVVQIKEGTQTVSIPWQVDLPGLHDISVLISADDSSASNNVYTSSLYIGANSGILIIEKYEDESAALREVLDQSIDVNVVDIDDFENLPSTVNELREYDQVILVNIANRDMPEGYVELLYSYVYDFGGGLFTVCGNTDDSTEDNPMANAYTRADMYFTRYQEMLPVQIIEYTPPTAVIILIDNSRSMCNSVNPAESKLEWAKLGAVECLDALTERDYVGIMSFSDVYDNEPVEIYSRTEREKIVSAIDEIQDGTDKAFGAAIERAGKALSEMTGVANRHIIIVTDGEPYSFDEETYKCWLRENCDNGITVSVTGVQCTAYVENKMTQLLMEYAGMTSDSFCAVDELNFIGMNMRAPLEAPAIKGVSYETFTLKIAANTSITEGINAEDMPTLDGFYGVKAKAGAEVILMGQYTPIYTRWEFGLGAVGTFACDLNGRWSAEFLASPVGATLINNILRDLCPSENIRPQDIGVKITSENYSHRAMVTAELEEGQYIEFTVMNINGEEIFTATATAAEAPRFLFEITEQGVYTIIARRNDADGTILSEYVCYTAFSYSQEYNTFYDRDAARERMEDLAMRGNGKVVKNPEDVYVFGEK